jgi:hypothetical protein
MLLYPGKVTHLLIDDPGRIRVVTSDRRLADRVHQLGGKVEPARSFRRRLEAR